MNMRKKKIVIGFLIFASIGIGFYTGFLYGKFQCKICPPEELDFSLFWQAYYKLKENFVDKEKMDLQKIIYGAISGMVKSLGDPYTVFLTPEENKIFQEDVKGYFEGVGMEVGIKKGKLTVIAPLENTPAKKAGILSGDIILEIDGKPTLDMTLEEAVKLIRGPKGTVVKLKIIREGWEKPEEFQIERAVIEIPSLKIEEKDGIIYLKIYHFSEKLRSDFRVAVNQILKNPSKKIILDLRDNPGGFLEVAVDVGSYFIEKGKLIAIEEYGDGTKEEFYSRGPGVFSDYKIMILVNQGTASGAEILASALRENLGTMLIGEKTFGKGSVQKLENLKGGSALKITIAKWLTSKGQQISEIGLDPDLKIETKPKDIEEGKDPQLEKAIEILKSL